MPAWIETDADEARWAKAKERAAQEGHDKDWAYVTGVYKRMNGGSVDSKSGTDASGYGAFVTDGVARSRAFYKSAMMNPELIRSVVRPIAPALDDVLRAIVGLRSPVKKEDQEPEKEAAIPPVKIEPLKEFNPLKIQAAVQAFKRQSVHPQFEAFEKLLPRMPKQAAFLGIGEPDRKQDLTAYVDVMRARHAYQRNRLKYQQTFRKLEPKHQREILRAYDDYHQVLEDHILGGRIQAGGAT